MIYLVMCGRLGNQLFQYSFAKHIQMMTGQELAIDFTAIKQVKNPEWRNYLDDFCVGTYKIVDKNDYYPIQRFIYKVAKMMRPKNVEKAYLFDEKYAGILNKLGVIFYESDYHFHAFKVPKTKNIIIRGWFESEKYFNDLKTQLFKELIPSYKVSKANFLIKRKLEYEKGICLSVRKWSFGDKDKKLLEEFFVCTKDYYYSAIKYMLSVVPDGILYICSDDIEWCKQHFSFPVPVIYEERAAYAEKLYMMSLCKHFILSNSTFSWWAQYLSDNEDKIVVAPSIWRKCELSPMDIYSPGWVLINSLGELVSNKGSK